MEGDRPKVSKGRSESPLVACKGVPPLTLFRDWIERTFMLCPRVYAGISLPQRRPPLLRKSTFPQKSNSLT